MDRALGKRNTITKLALGSSKNYSKSAMENKDRIRFAEFYDIDSPKIDPIFLKNCKCAGILVVDDQYINRFIIVQFCQKYNIPCDEAGDGKQAVDKIKAAAAKPCCKGYSLVLMDLNMPVMGGIEATMKIIELKDNRE